MNDEKSIRERSQRAVTRHLNAPNGYTFYTHRWEDGEVSLDIYSLCGGSPWTLMDKETRDLYELLKLALDKADE